MNQQDLVEMLRQRPFRIHLGDSTVHDIRHPEMMVVDWSKALIFFPPSNMSLPVIERYEVVALAHMTRLEPLQRSPV